MFTFSDQIMTETKRMPVPGLKYNFFDEDFMNDESVFKLGYDWIIIANFITAIGERVAYQDVNKLLNKSCSFIVLDTCEDSDQC